MGKKIELSSKRKVELKEMSIDEVDFCSDIAEIIYDEAGEVSRIKGVSKARTSWLRRGIAGGDFKNFSNWSANSFPLIIIDFY